MSHIDYMEVLKWAAIVLGAGFIGHFGRAFAEYLIDRARKKRELTDQSAANDNTQQPQPAAPLPEETGSIPDRADWKTGLKAEKKARKAEIKLRKKAK